MRSLTSSLLSNRFQCKPYLLGASQLELKYPLTDLCKHWVYGYCPYRAATQRLLMSSTGSCVRREGHSRSVKVNPRSANRRWVTLSCVRGRMVVGCWLLAGSSVGVCNSRVPTVSWLLTWLYEIDAFFRLPAYGEHVMSIYFFTNPLFMFVCIVSSFLHNYVFKPTQWKCHFTTFL